MTWTAEGSREANADYIAEASPDTVLHLLDEIDRLEAANADYRKEVTSWMVHHKSWQETTDALRQYLDSWKKQADADAARADAAEEKVARLHGLIKAHKDACALKDGGGWDVDVRLWGAADDA